MEKIRSMLSGRAWLILLAAVTVVHCSAPPSERREPSDSGTGDAPAEPNYSECPCSVTVVEGIPFMDLDCYCSKFVCPTSFESASRSLESRFVDVYYCPDDVPDVVAWSDGWNSAWYQFKDGQLVGGRLGFHESVPECEGTEFGFGSFEYLKRGQCRACLVAYAGQQAPEGECLDEDIVDEPSVGGMGGIVW